MVTFYLFVLGVGVIGAVAYLALFMSHIPGAADERLGALEKLPDNLGSWVADAELSSDGLVRESRHLEPERGLFGRPKLLLQVRYRDPNTREILRIEPEVVVIRKRIRNAKADT